MFSFKKGARRVSTVTAFAAVVSLALSGVAVADDIANSLDATVDAVAEAMPLNVGGDNGTTSLYVTPRNGDGKNGCNLTGSTTLTLSVSSSNTAVATVSPSTVTFTACSDSMTLTIVPVAAGSATLSVSQVGNTTGASFNLDPATFTVNVAPPANTAPQISVDGVTGGASYDKGSVPTATCKVTDAEDGSSSFPATLSTITGSYASDGIGSQTASCSYTDKGTPALTASASETYSIVDPSAPVIGYTLNPAAPDGSNGWFKSGVTLTWNVTDPQSPNSVQTTGCVDQTINGDQAVATYTCSATSAGGPAAAQAVTIGRDATPPAVSDRIVWGTEGSNDWYTSDVEVEFSATDATSGVSASTTSPRTVRSSGEGSAVTITSPTFTDEAGNTSAAVIKTFKIDKTKPVAPIVSLNPPANGAGWHNGDVEVTFTDQGDGGTDGSGVAYCTAPVTVNLETPGEAVSGTCTDEAGNVSDATEVTVKLDKTGPVVTTAVPTNAPTGSNGWYTSDVTVEFTATDALSGLTQATKQVTSSGEGEMVAVNSPAFTDIAGNTTNAGALTPTPTFMIDKTAPAIPTFSASMSQGDTFYFGSVPAEPTCQSSDATSGLASCVVSGYGTALGSHTLTATATDNAGNTKTATMSYAVLAWTVKGFYAPVDMNGVLNTVKGGSTVPLKFELFAGPTELTSVELVSFSVSRITCTTGAVEDAIEAVTTGGTSLRYDSTGGQFIQNWKTPTGAGTCYQAKITANDGSTITARFKIK